MKKKKEKKKIIKKEKRKRGRLVYGVGGGEGNLGKNPVKYRIRSEQDRTSIKEEGKMSLKMGVVSKIKTAPFQHDQCRMTPSTVKVHINKISHFLARINQWYFNLESFTSGESG